MNAIDMREAMKDPNERGQYLAAIRARGKDVLLKDIETLIDILIDSTVESDAFRKERDELRTKNSALQLSQDNIINALGIKGEGAHSKQVIEYVMGLVAENEKLKSTITEINNELYGQGFEVLGWHLNGDTEPLDNWFTDNGWGAPETPNTDAFTAELRTQGVALAISHLNKKFTNLGVPITSLEWLEVELRAGRKG